MTTELEKQFFECFGIEQIYRYHVRDMGRSYCGDKQMLIDNKYLFMDKERRRSRRLHVVSVNKIYPEITDRKLLELIAIVAKHRVLKVYATTYQELKNDIIKTSILLKDDIPNANKRFNYIDEIKALFEGE